MPFAAGMHSSSFADDGSRPGSGNGTRYGLSKREHQVLALLVDGLSDNEIAQHLGLAKNTASKHVRAVREKLDVRSRTEAAVRALREGLVDAV